MDINNKVVKLCSWPKPLSQKSTKEIIQRRQNQRKEDLKSLNQKWLNRLTELD